MSMGEQLLLRQVRHVRPDLDDPRTATVRQQIWQDFGMIVPPFLLHLPAPAALSASWAIIREPTHGHRVPRAVKEAVAASVSAANACPYCVDVHTTALHALGDRAAAAAIASGRSQTITDPTLHAVVSGALATREPDAPILRRRPFPDEHAPELIGVVLAYHYINRMVNIFVAGSPFPVTKARSVLKEHRRTCAPSTRCRQRPPWCVPRPASRGPAPGRPRLGQRRFDHRGRVRPSGRRV